MKKIILISGKAENGKTTCANMLQRQLFEDGYRTIIVRYAYYLKDIAKRFCKWNGVKDEKGRNLLQYLGTDIIRKKLNKPDFHVARVCEDIEICQDYFDYVIIDDTRFPNEIEYPIEKFGKDNVVTIRINRMDENDIYKPYVSSLTDEQKHHISEIALDNYDFDYYIITNSFEMMNEQLDQIKRSAIDNKKVILEK